MSRGEKVIIALLIVLATSLFVSGMARGAEPRLSCATSINLTDRYARHVATGADYFGPVHRYGCKRTPAGIARRYAWRDPELGYVTGFMRVKILRGKLHPYCPTMSVTFNDDWIIAPANEPDTGERTQ